MFPDKFVGALAKANAAARKWLAKAWASTEELADAGVTEAAALLLVEELVALAARSSKGQLLYLLSDFV